MSEKENDSLSVESGSCDCSDYNSDMSWFYFSKNLQTSHFEFSIINIKKEEKKEEILEDKKEEEDLKQNDFKIKVNLIKEQNKIRIPKFIRNEYNSTENFHTNISKKYTHYRTKYKMALKNNKGLDLYLNNEQNKDEINRQKTEYKEGPIKEIKKEEQIQTHNRHYTNKVNRYRFFNIANPNKENNNDKENNSLEKENNVNKEEEKKVENNEENDNKVKVPKYLAFRRRFFNSYKNSKNFKGIYKKENDKNDNINVEQNKNNNREETNNDLSKKVRGKTLNERVVTETKNLALQPGQIIKPKIVTKRMLKPITNIVTNDDGTQNIITENTTLTTTIINELLDSTTKKDDDKYPLDIQLVRQHITKTYVTEIESNPYVPRKRFSHFN